jgi:hypothetical protein
LHQSDLIPSGDRSSYSLRPGVYIGGRRRGIRLQDDIGKLQSPSGFENPVNFPEEPGLVGGKIDHSIGDHHIEHPVGKRQPLRGDEVNFSIFHLKFLQASPGSPCHLLAQVNAADTACLADQTGCHIEIEPCPAADIQNGTPLVYGLEGKGVSHAAERIEKFVRQCIKNSCIVAQGLGPDSTDRILEIPFGRAGDATVFFLNRGTDQGQFLLGKGVRFKLVFRFSGGNCIL